MIVHAWPTEPVKSCVPEQMELVQRLTRGFPLDLLSSQVVLDVARTQHWSLLQRVLLQTVTRVDHRVHGLVFFLHSQANCHGFLEYLWLLDDKTGSSQACLPYELSPTLALIGQQLTGLDCMGSD